MEHYTKATEHVRVFEEELIRDKSRLPEIPWYPYGTLNNFQHIRNVVDGEIDLLFSRNMQFADVGAADGDLSFFLESLGHRGEIFDFGPTNYNTLRGARAMKDLRSSNIKINEINLDAYFSFEGRFDLIFFLGIMYHLHNPFYVLEQFAHRSRYMILSTRIARHFKAGSEDVSKSSAAYLLDADESNGDATNFWVFTEAGLRRILDRTGWDIVRYWSGGDTAASTPQDADHDERAFCTVRSRFV